MKKFVFGMILLTALNAAAYSGCDQAEQMAREQGLAKALVYYESCALETNDDAAQALLGHAYLNGVQGVPKNMQKALLFYHLSADNGNASSQVALAKLLLKLDENNAGRAQINAYLRKIQTALKNQGNGAFKGELLHPYTLLVLAAEQPEQKWFYVSNDLQSDEAGRLVKSYRISDVKKKQALQDATTWKQNKMRLIAEEIYSSDEYKKFMQTVFPDSGMADAFGRDQAVKKLKQDIQKYKEQ